VFGKAVDVDTLKEIIDFSKVVSASVIGLKGAANSYASAIYGLDTPINISGYPSLVVFQGDDEPSQSTLKRLEEVSYLIVFASYTSALTAKADVVLPVQNWAEQDGHYLSTDGKLQESHKSLVSDEYIPSNVDALSTLANGLGIKITGDWKKELTSNILPIAIKKC